MEKKYTSQDCSTSSTRRNLFTTVTPHDKDVRNILDRREYTLDTYRIYNGSDYRDRAHTSIDTSFENYPDVVRLKEKITPFDTSGLYIEESCESGLERLEQGDRACNDC